MYLSDDQYNLILYDPTVVSKMLKKGDLKLF